MVPTWRLQPVLQALVSVEVLSSLIWIRKSSSVHGRTWSWHYLMGFPFSKWPGLVLLKEMPKDPVLLWFFIAHEVATDAADDLVRPWASNAEVMDAWRISWSAVLQRLIILSSSLQLLIPAESSWMAQRTSAFRKNSPNAKLFVVHKPMPPSPGYCQMLSAVRAGNCLCSLS